VNIVDSNGRWSHWKRYRYVVHGRRALPNNNVGICRAFASSRSFHGTNPAPPNAAEQVIAQSAGPYEWIEVR
jgi:hypothetical protein